MKKQLLLTLCLSLISSPLYSKSYTATGVETCWQFTKVGVGIGASVVGVGLMFSGSAFALISSARGGGAPVGKVSAFSFCGGGALTGGGFLLTKSGLNGLRELYADKKEREERELDRDLRD